MKQSRHELDPRGDVELILQNPNRQHFSWPKESVMKVSIEQSSSNSIFEKVHQPKDVCGALFLESTAPSRKKTKKKSHRRDHSPDPPERVPLFEPEPVPVDWPVAEPIPEPEPVEEPAATPEPEFAYGTELAVEPDVVIEPKLELDARSANETPEVVSGQADVLNSGLHVEPNFSLLGYDEDRDEMRLRVSSRHLSLASPVFRTMLDGPWKESISNGQSFRTIETSEWDSEAIIILLDIIHGHHRDVPRSVSLEMLGKIAVLTDYYNCHEVIEVFVELWIAGLENNLPTSYGKDSTIWLCISCVFSRPRIFDAMVEIAMKECQGTLCSMDLPIPHGVLKTIEDQRENAITKMFGVLDELRKSLRNNEGCSTACSSMLLGSLIKQMHKNGIDEERPESPFLGHSVDSVKTMILNFETPAWCSFTYGYSSYHQLHSSTCDLRGNIEPAINEIVTRTKLGELFRSN